jgi:molybdopterin synthase sulfur carrier subunit
LKVRVRVFASLREILGKDEVEVDLPEGTTVEGLWTQLVSDDGRLEPFTKSINFAINHDFVGKETPLSPNDEIAFLPPVSGG